jgi:hypothetical protein
MRAARPVLSPRQWNAPFLRPSQKQDEAIARRPSTGANSQAFQVRYLDS